MGESGSGGLHVLLRHRLLPQPGGFEGVGLVDVAQRLHETCVRGGPRPQSFSFTLTESVDVAPLGSVAVAG